MINWQDIKIHIYLAKVFMQPQLNIPLELLDNQHLFEDEFFTSRPLSRPNTDLVLPDGQSRRYQFPTYFNEVKFNAGIFLGNYQKIKEQLPKDLKPVSVPGGRGMVIFASYHYGQIHEMPGYNEVLVMVPVLHKSLSVPLIPPLVNGYPGMGYYILALPMTNLENQLRGQQFWGLPKRLHEVEIIDGKRDSLTRIQSNGELDFEFRIAHGGNVKRQERRNSIYSVKDDQLIRFESHFSGDITNNSNWKVLFNRSHSLNAAQPELVLGDTPLGDKLKTLQINPHAFETRYCEHLKSCLYLPNQYF